MEEYMVSCFNERETLEFIRINTENDIEIVLEEDVTFSDNFVLPELPSITETPRLLSLLTCRFCSKSYKKLYFFEKHLTVCQSLTKVTSLTSSTTLLKQTASCIPSTDFCNIKEECLHFIWSSISDAATHAIFNLKVGSIKTPGNICASLALSMMTQRDNINLLEFNEILSQHFIQILQINSVNNLVKEKQSVLINNLCLHLKLKEIWGAILLSHMLEEHLHGQHILYHFIVTKVYEKLLIWRNNQLDVKNPVAADLALTTQEEKTLRYVAGFIAFSLAKRFKNQKNESAKIVLKLLESWREYSDQNLECENIYDYTKTWAEKINRGGLFCVNMDFYIFIYRIEQVVRQTLSKSLLTKYKGMDLRDVIMPLLQNNKRIDSIWTSLTCNIKLKELAGLLKDTIFKKWINLRIKSFVDTWIQIAKKNRSVNISNKSEPSIRKTLNKKKN